MENVTKILTVILSILVAVNALNNTKFIPISDGKTGVQLNMTEFCQGVINGTSNNNTYNNSTNTSEEGIQWEFDTDWLKIIINPKELCTKWNTLYKIPPPTNPPTTEPTDSTPSSTEVSPTSSTLSETATSTEVPHNETTNVTSTTPVPTVSTPPLHNQSPTRREPNDNTTSTKPTPTETAATTSSPISTSTSKPYDSNNVDTLKGNKDNGGMSPGLMYFLIIAASFICGVLVAWGVITLRRRYKADDYNVCSREEEMGTRRP